MSEESQEREPAAELAPPTGSDRPEATGITPGEEPRATGTLFLVMIILMIIAAVWIIMYIRLLDR
jgi:hypothetical protein